MRYENMENDQLITKVQEHINEVQTVLGVLAGRTFGEKWEVETNKIVDEQPKYKTEKRVAEIGERVLILDAQPLITPYKNGDIFTVTEVDGFAVDVKENNNICLYHEEYEVITESEQVPIAETFEAFVDELTPNEQRAELIQRTRAFVEEHTEFNAKVAFTNVEGIRFNQLVVVPEFIVNKDKRTVVVLLKGAFHPIVITKGIAKCMLGDVFNADIGKAIALARALEIDVPEEFLNAVQPDEFVVGQITQRDGGTLFEITKLDDDKAYTVPGTYWYRKLKDNSSLKGIIDDTNAEYGTSP